MVALDDIRQIVDATHVVDGAELRYRAQDFWISTTTSALCLATPGSTEELSALLHG